MVTDCTNIGFILANQNARFQRPMSKSEEFGHFWMQYCPHTKYGLAALFEQFPCSNRDFSHFLENTIVTTININLLTDTRYSVPNTE